MVMSIGGGGNDLSLEGDVESLRDLDRFRDQYISFQATLRTNFDLDGTGGTETLRAKTELDVPGLDRNEVAELVYMRPERVDMFIDQAGVITTPQSGHFETSLYWPYSIGLFESQDGTTDTITQGGGITYNSGFPLGDTATGTDEVYRGYCAVETGFNDSSNGSGGGGSPVVQATNLNPINYRHQFGRGPITGAPINENAWEELGVEINGQWDNQEQYTVETNASFQCYADVWELSDRQAQDVRRRT